MTADLPREIDICRKAFEAELRSREPHAMLTFSGKKYTGVMAEFDWQMWQAAWKASADLAEKPVDGPTIAQGFGAAMAYKSKVDAEVMAAVKYVEINSEYEGDYMHQEPLRTHLKTLIRVATKNMGDAVTREDTGLTRQRSPSPATPCKCEGLVEALELARRYIEGELIEGALVKGKTLGNFLDEILSEHRKNMGAE